MASCVAFCAVSCIVADVAAAAASPRLEGMGLVLARAYCTLHEVEPNAKGDESCLQVGSTSEDRGLRPAPA